MHQLIQLSKRIWHMDLDYATDRPNLGYIQGDDRSLMFDCGASPAHVSDFMELLQEHGLPLPEIAVLSHWHWDHALGMAALKERGIPVIACRQTDAVLGQVSSWEWTEEAMRERLKSGEEILFCDDFIRKEYRGDLSAIPRFCVADILFEKTKTVDLGGITAQLIRVGGPHSEDSVVCYVPEEKFVFLADSAGKDLYGKPWAYDPNDQAASDLAMERIPDDPQRLRAYRKTLEQLDFERCLKGHALCLDRSEWMEELQEREARL